MYLLSTLDFFCKVARLTCWAGVVILTTFPARAGDEVSGKPQVSGSTDPKNIIALPDAPKPASPVGVKIGIPGWLSAISGEVGARGRVSNTQYIPFSSVLSHLDYVIPGSIEVSYGKWGMLLEGQFTKLGMKLNPRDNLFDAGEINMEQAFADFNVSYKVVDTEKLSLSPFIGTRLEYVRLKGSLTPTAANPIPLPFNNNADQLWADPILGLQGRFQIYKPISLVGKADVGGFGAASHLTYQLFGGAEIQMTRNFNIAVGYRYMETDYESGGFTYNLAFSGPQITCGVNF